MLTKIWDFLFHRHQWEIHEEANLILEEQGRKMIKGKLYVLKCTKCGNIKSVKVDCSHV